MSDEPVKGKIHVDSDWKAEAAETKERLAAEEQAQGQQQPGALPDPTLAELVNMIAMPAAMALGGYTTPDGRSVPMDLGAAKFHIDLLSVLEEKTKGNLTEAESGQLSALLHQLRAQFTAIATEIGRAAAPPTTGQG